MFGMSCMFRMFYGVQQGMQYASLTDIITREWSGMSTKQYKQFKGLKKESLRDNMTNMEIALNMLAEASATELSKQRDPKGFSQQKQIAKDGGSVAKVARNQLMMVKPPLLSTMRTKVSMLPAS